MPDLPKRKPTRLKNYDYSSAGAYFITICTEKRKKILSEICVGTPVPTDSVIARFVSTFKRFCNKEYGKNIWQYRSNDHIIRNTDEYEKIWDYIEHNVVKWEEDSFYC